MEAHQEGVAFLWTQSGAAEERMLDKDLVRGIAARRDRGESTYHISQASFEFMARRSAVGCELADGDCGKTGQLDLVVPVPP